MGKRYVISGGPGTGKSTILEKLKSYPGIWVHQESARAIADGDFGDEEKRLWEGFVNAREPEQRKKARLVFERAVLARDIEAFEEAPTSKDCFFDCGIVEAYSYLELENIEIPKEFLDALKGYRYDSVFILPEWLELFKSRDKPEVVEWARKLAGIISSTYERLGYKPVIVPKGTPEQRASFITKHTNPKG